MDKLIVEGNSDLYGSVNVSGSKNASLPILVSSLLSSENLELTNIPQLDDIMNMKKLLISYGVKVKDSSNGIILNANNISNKITDYDVVRKMRASILVLGPLLSRFNKAIISLPGGCAIGTRPIDIHLQGLAKLGVKFEIENGLVKARADNQLIGNYIKLSFPSVGATENILMASIFAKGKTIIDNAAREPEIVDLVDCLKKMGANINGEGNSKLEIVGVKNLKQAKHTILNDRIVAGTYIIAAIMLNKEFTVNNINHKHIESLLEILKKMGANLKIYNNSIKIFPTKKLKGIKIATAPYPGFPTDLQAQIMALMGLASGNSEIKESIFENRFMHVAELNRLGAKIKIKNETAYISGNIKYKGAQVMASDLRASVSLVLAGLCADGNTTINRVYHLDRGYEKIEETLLKCGPKINRQKY